MRRQLLVMTVVAAVLLVSSPARATAGQEGQSTQEGTKSPPSRAQAATAANHVHRLVPTISLSGTTEGSAVLEVGASLAMPMGKGHWTLELAPTYEVAMENGLATVLSIARAREGSDSERSTTRTASRPWRLGFKATFSRLGSFNAIAEAEAQGLDAASLQLRREALQGCVARCVPENASEFCTSWSNRHKALQAARDSLAVLLKTVTKRHNEVVESLPETFPRKTFSDDVSAFTLAGEQMLIGLASELVRAGERFRTVTTTTGALASTVTSTSRTKETLSDFKNATLAAFAAMGELQRRELDVTVYGVDWQQICPEAPQRLLLASLDRDRVFQVSVHTLGVKATYGQTSFDYVEPVPGTTLLYQEYSDITRTSGSAAVMYTYVTPARRLTLEVPLAYESAWRASDKTIRWCTPVGQVLRDAAHSEAGSDPGATCQEMALNGPSRADVVNLSVLGGFLPSGMKPAWRVSLGITYRRRTAAERTETSYGIVAPMYFKVAGAEDVDVGVYKGLVRVTPSFVWTTQGAKTGYRAAVLVALLGSRSMFGSALD